MTPYVKVIDRFERKIQKDKKYFCYGNEISDEDLINTIHRRSLGLLIDSCDDLQEMINIQQRQNIDFTDRDDMLEEFNIKLKSNEEDLISELMVVKYFDETLIAYRELAKVLGEDIKKVFSPNEERKTLLDMVEYKHKQFDDKLSRYNSIDRNTGEYLLAY